MISLLAVPLFVLISGILMYRFSGRKQLLKFDLVQFIYAFVLAPVFFIWTKRFLFFLLKNELDLKLTIGQILSLDSLFSLFFLYIYAFVVIHSLTKSFHLNKKRNPKLDIYELSEYFHLDFSHLSMYISAMLIATLFSTLNLAFPFQIENVRNIFYSFLSLGLFSGLVGFIILWMYESPDPKFMRIIKLASGLFFLVHVAIYFIFDPQFSMAYAFYWFIFGIFATFVFLFLFAERREKRKRFWQRLPFQINPVKVKYYWKYLKKYLAQKLSK